MTPSVPHYLVGGMPVPPRRGQDRLGPRPGRHRSPRAAPATPRALTSDERPSTSRSMAA